MVGGDRSSVREEIVPGAKRLFVIFGGIAGAIGMPPFEFYRTARILSDSKIFLRDPHQAWYQRGLPSIGDDVYALRDFLRGRIAAAGPSEVRFLGNSMGGYAAILFCSLLKCGRAIAFAPQTFLGVERLRACGDTRWQAQLAALHQHRPPSPFDDLRMWLREQDPHIRADIYVSRLHALDWLHANELREFENIRVHAFTEGGHSLIRHLRDAGELHAILKS